jgi:hypothetical protein
VCVFRVFRPVQTQREIRKTNERDTKQKNDSKREREFRERERERSKKKKKKKKKEKNKEREKNTKDDDDEILCLFVFVFIFLETCEYDDENDSRKTKEENDDENKNHPREFNRRTDRRDHGWRGRFVTENDKSDERARQKVSIGITIRGLFVGRRSCFCSFGERVRVRKRRVRGAREEGSGEFNETLVRERRREEEEI